MGHDEEDGSANAGPGASFRARMINVNAMLRFSFFQYDEVKVRPFIAAGIGYLQFNDLNNNSSKFVVLGID